MKLTISSYFVRRSFDSLALAQDDSFFYYFITTLVWGPMVSFRRDTRPRVSTVMKQRTKNRVILSGAKRSRRIYAFGSRLQLIQCEDPSSLCSSG